MRHKFWLNREFRGLWIGAISFALAVSIHHMWTQGNIRTASRLL